MPTWTSLRGRVVVLEFWATWCAPCVANIPHLNELAASLDPKQVQIISVDDEQPAVVKSFLEKRHVAGWIAFDQNGSTFRRFEVAQRPATIVVDSIGHVALVTTPELLKREDIMRIVGLRKSVVQEASAPMEGATPQKTALFDLTLTASAPNTPYSMNRSKDGKLTILGIKPDDLLTWAFDVPSDRLALRTALPSGTFDFRASLGDASDAESMPMFQAAVAMRPTREREADDRDEVRVRFAGSRRCAKSAGACRHSRVYVWVLAGKDSHG